MEGWKDGRLEGWKVGRLDGWKVRRLECSRGLIISPVSRHFHRAERRRREARACVSVFERRSHLGPPAEGRPGPSDDDEDYVDYDDDDISICTAPIP